MRARVVAQLLCLKSVTTFRCSKMCHDFENDSKTCNIVAWFVFWSWYIPTLTFNAASFQNASECTRCPHICREGAALKGLVYVTRENFWCNFVAAKVSDRMLHGTIFNERLPETFEPMLLLNQYVDNDPPWCIMEQWRFLKKIKPSCIYKRKK